MTAGVTNNGVPSATSASASNGVGTVPPRTIVAPSRAVSPRLPSGSQEQMGYSPEESANSLRVLIVIDIAGWAYHNIFLALRRYAPKNFIVTACGDRPTRKDLDGIDGVLVLPYGQIDQIAEAVGKYRPGAAMIGQLNVGFGHRVQIAEHMMKLVDAVVHVNWNSYIRYGCRDMQYQISHGVDFNLFKPIVPIKKRPRRVLWTGSEIHKTLKGHEILESLQPQLAEHDIELDLQLVNSRNPPKTHREMASWYNAGSVYVVASKTEGTPNPGLESAACGCAVVSTRVGNMPELISSGWNGVLVDERTPDALLAGILEAMEQRERFAENMRHAIVHWSWADRALRYFDLFEQVINGTLPPRAWNQEFDVEAIRRELSESPETSVPS